MAKLDDYYFVAFRKPLFPRLDDASFDGILCECGEIAEEKTCTKNERTEVGCGRYCCSIAFECSSCGKRIALGKEAPEMEDF